ncbi:MAG: cellulase family glycosylhydrolase [Planctomycetota bacterium]
MKTGLLVTPAFLLLVFSIGAGTDAGWLHTDGRWIKDAGGNVVTLRGVNMFVRLQNEQAKFAAAKAAGANVIRLMLWKQDVETPGTNAPGFDQSGLAAIDRAVGWAHDAGMYVILEQQIWSPKVEPAPAAFFSDPALQAQWLAMWRVLVDRYKNDPTVIGIDPMNEPYSVSGVTVPDPMGTWETIVKNAVNDLRPRNPHLIFFIEGWGPRTTPGFRDVAFLQQPNTVYSDHIYYKDAYPVHAWATAYSTGDLERGKALFSQLADKRWTTYTDKGIPVWLGEIGFSTTSPHWREQMADELALLDERGIGYALFCCGVSHWKLEWDMVDASYGLTTVGRLYSEHITSAGRPRKQLN